MAVRIRSVHRALSAHPRWVAVGLYAAVALAAAAAAYVTIFTQFASYDDEGTVLTTVQAFAHGEILYRNIYTEYGPFYYELFGGLFALTGHAVTNDASRSIVIVVWVTTSLLFGLVAQRLTGMLALGLAGMIAAFSALVVLEHEPMHPHGLSVLLIGAFFLLAVSEWDRRGRLVGGACGALLAALLLTKVNLGAFALAAVALAAVLTLEPLYRRLWVRLPVMVAFLALPVFIVARDLNEAWARDLVALQFLAALAVVVAAFPLRPQREEADATMRRWLIAAILAFIVAFAAIVGAILLTGPSPANVYEGVVGNAFSVRDLFVLPVPLPNSAVDWGVAAVAGATLATTLRPSRSGEPTIWPGLLKAIAGLVIWFTVARIAPLSINPSGGNPNTLPLVLAWIAAVPPVGARESAQKRFVRVLLPAFAVAEVLQIYPVPGSQLGIASLMFIPVGALCLSDAVVALRAWSRSRPGAVQAQLGVVLSVVTIALVAQFGLDAIARPGVSNAILYRHQPELRLTGATMLHLPAPEEETYTEVSDLIAQHRCTALVGYPSINSFYLWTGIEPPAPQLPGPWMDALDPATQQGIVDQVRASPRPCAIRADDRAAGWLEGQPPPQTPLVRYIFDDFEQAAEVGDIKFLLPRGERPGSRGTS